MYLPNNGTLVITVHILSNNPATIKNVVMIVKVDPAVRVDDVSVSMSDLTVCHNPLIYKLSFHHSLHKQVFRCRQNDTDQQTTRDVLL